MFEPFGPDDLSTGFPTATENFSAVTSGPQQFGRDLGANDVIASATAPKSPRIQVGVGPQEHRGVVAERGRDRRDGPLVAPEGSPPCAAERRAWPKRAVRSHLRPAATPRGASWRSGPGIPQTIASSAAIDSIAFHREGYSLW